VTAASANPCGSAPAIVASLTLILVTASPSRRMRIKQPLLVVSMSRITLRANGIQPSPPFARLNSS